MIANWHEAYGPLARDIGNAPEKHAGKERSALMRTHRPWWVCCYGTPTAQWDRERLIPTPWTNGQRQLSLLTLKTFRTLTDAHASAAYDLDYRPFNSPHAVVLLLHASRAAPRIIQFTLRDHDD